VRVVVQNEDHAPAAVASADDGRADWRVIAYTYDGRQDAEQKAAAVAKRYPGLHPAVLKTASGKHYLVVLGPAMVREAAEKLRAEAIRMGLPRDTYAQNIR
jgi:cell division protein FtsN